MGLRRPGRRHASRRPVAPPGGRGPAAGARFLRHAGAGPRLRLVLSVAAVVAACACRPAVAQPAPATGSAGQAPSAEPPGARVDRLLAQIRSGEDVPGARERLIALGRAGTPRLLERRRDSDWRIRWEFANVQGHVLDDRAVEPLVEAALHDDESHVRYYSLWALTRYPGPQTDRAIAALRAALEGPWAWNAAVGLSYWHVRDGLDILHAGLTTRARGKRLEALRALGRIGDVSSVPHVARVLARGRTAERRESALVLGKTRTPAAVPPLLRALDDENPGVRWRACKALGQLGDPRAIQPIADLLALDADATLREQCTSALEILVGLPPPTMPPPATPEDCPP